MVVIYSFLIIYLCLIPVLVNNFLNLYTLIINPGFWLFIFIVTKLFFDNKKRFRFKEEKIQTTLIISIIYSVVFFFAGLLFGYGNSPYSHSLIGIITNIWVYLIVVFFKEAVRTNLVNNHKKIVHYLFIIILFTLLDLNYYNFASNFINGETIFKYLFSVFLISLFKNCLLVYLSYYGGLGLNLSYLVPILIVQLFIPILPDYNWFILLLFELIFIIIVFFNINRLNFKRNRFISRRKVKRLSWQFGIFIFINVFIALFIIGVFKYMPIVIMSNSMSELILRGDIVVIEKIEDKKSVQVNDIISYRLNNTYIIHRVIDIKKMNSQTFFITKGDNNQFPDSKLVSEQQVTGIVKLKIPKLGYPSVVLGEILQN